MKQLNRNEKIAVVAGLGVLAYLLFAGPIMSLFNKPSVTERNNVVRETGYTIEEVAVGNGPLAEPGDTLTVHYVGNLENGEVFDSSLTRGEPFSFTLGVGQVIRGWDEGLRGMRAGGKRNLVIAPEYGYGDMDLGAIPPNSVLIFQVELLEVSKPQ